VPEVKQYNHLAPFYKRLPQQLLHAFLLPYFDKKRIAFGDDTYPRKLGAELVTTLRQQLMEGLCPESAQF